MSDPRRHAAALAVLLALLVPAAAAADAPVLVAQIEDAAPTPQPQPPLSEDPPETLDGGDGDEEPAGEGAQEEAGPALPDTGAEAAVTALLGLGLLASGGGLRLTLAGDGRRR